MTVVTVVFWCEPFI